MVTVVSKSLTSVLIETFMTDWSRTITNCAVANATNGHQRFIGQPFLMLVRRGIHLGTRGRQVGARGAATPVLRVGARPGKTATALRS